MKIFVQSHTLQLNHLRREPVEPPIIVMDEAGLRHATFGVQLIDNSGVVIATVKYKMGNSFECWVETRCNLVFNERYSPE